MADETDLHVRGYDETKDALTDAARGIATFYSQQRYALVQHTEYWRRLTEDLKRMQEESNRGARQTREELGYLAKQVEETKKRIVEAFSAVEIMEFAKKGAEAFMGFERAMNTLRDSAQLTVEDIKETEEMLKRLEAQTGRSKESFIPAINAYNAAILGSGPAARAAFEEGAQAAELLGAKTKDTTQVIATQIKLLHEPIADVDREMAHVTATLRGVGGGFEAAVPHLLRLFQAYNINMKDAHALLSDYFKVAMQGMDPSQADQFTSLIEKAFSVPFLRAQTLQNAAGGVQGIFASLVNQLRILQSRPDILAQMGFSPEQILEVRNLTAAVDDQGKIIKKVGDDAGTVGDQMNKHTDDTLGHVNKLKGAYVELREEIVATATEAAKPILVTLTKAFEGLAHVIRELNELTTGKRSIVRQEPTYGRTDWLPSGAAPPGVVPYQTGGVVTQPTLAMLGEAGPEAVIPMEDVQRAQARDAAAQQQAQAQQAQTTQEEAATVQRVHQLALLEREPQHQFRDWDDMLKGQDVGGGGAGAPGGTTGPDGTTSPGGTRGGTRGDGTTGTPGDGRPVNVEGGVSDLTFFGPDTPATPGAAGKPWVDVELDKKTRGTRNLGKPLIGRRDEAQSDYLREERKAFADEYHKMSPEQKLAFRAAMYAENDQDPAAVAEAMANRMAYARSHEGQTKNSYVYGKAGFRGTIHGEMYSGFFGPITSNPAVLQRRIAYLRAHPEEAARVDRDIEYAFGGSNRLRGYGDQGGPGGRGHRDDPNYYRAVVFGRTGDEGYGPWPPEGGGEARREEQQRNVRAGTAYGGGATAGPALFKPVAPKDSDAQGNKADVAYVQAHGGHSSTLVDGKITGGPLGAAMGANNEFYARLAEAGRAYKEATGRDPEFGEADRTSAVQSIYWNRYQHGGGIAARPGRSAHQRSDAMDTHGKEKGGFAWWLRQGNAGRFGLYFPMAANVDYGHVQIDPRDKTKHLKADAPAQQASGWTPGKGQFEGFEVSKEVQTALQDARSKAQSPDPQTQAAGRRQLVFLHGMGYKRFGSPAEITASINADMQRVAAARGETLYVLPASGDNPAEQEKQLRAYLKLHPEADVEGFSAGGYTIARLEKDFPQTHFTKLGIGKGGADPRFPGVSHMKLPHAEAERAEAEKRTRDEAARTATKEIKTADATKPPADKPPPPTPKPRPTPAAQAAAADPGAARKKMARGGIATSPTDVTIGEAGPEAVVPLGDDINKILQQLGEPIRPDIEAPRAPSQERLYAAQRRASRQQDHWTSSANHRFYNHNVHADAGTGAR